MLERDRVVTLSDGPILLEVPHAVLIVDDPIRFDVARQRESALMQRPLRGLACGIDVGPIETELTLLARRLLRKCGAYIHCPLCNRLVPVTIHDSKIDEGCEHLKGMPLDITVHFQETID